MYMQYCSQLGLRTLVHLILVLLVHLMYFLLTVYIASSRFTYITEEAPVSRY